MDVFDQHIRIGHAARFGKAADVRFREVIENINAQPVICFRCFLNVVQYLFIQVVGFGHLQGL